MPTRRWLPAICDTRRTSASGPRSSKRSSRRGEAPREKAAFYRQYSQLNQADTAEYEHLLGEMSVPMRLIWGREDRILPPEYAEWLHDRIPHAELSWIEGAGHLLQEDTPAQLLAHVTADFPTRS